MILTFRYRLLPTRRQHRALEAILEKQRQLYNAALEERIGAFRKAGRSPAYFDQCKGLTEWRRDDADARALPVNLQRWTLKRLDDAYLAFFRRVRTGQKPGFPRFRGTGRFDSFGFRDFLGITLGKGRIRFNGFPGSLRFHLHRPIPEGTRIRSCVFRRGLKGWTTSFALEMPDEQLRRGARAVGIDLGITTFAALSDGGFIPSLRAARRAQGRLRAAQRALSRKARGSAGRRKARLQLARRHGDTYRRRIEHLHQASARVVRDYDTIVIEKLNVGGLARGMLAKDVKDASWGKFISMLRYKAAWAGVRLIEVDPTNTSQECSNCGTMVPKGLHERVHDCPRCGVIVDRDLNAARNLLKRAGVGPRLPNVAGCGMRAGGILDATAGLVTAGGCVETLPDHEPLSA